MLDELEEAVLLEDVLLATEDAEPAAGLLLVDAPPPPPQACKSRVSANKSRARAVRPCFWQEWMAAGMMGVPLYVILVVLRKRRAAPFACRSFAPADANVANPAVLYVVITNFGD